MESTVASEIEGVLDDLANHSIPSSGLEALHARGQRGEDLGRAVQVLTKTLTSATDVRLLEKAGETLLWHWHHSKNLDQLLPMLHRVRWPRYLALGLESLSEAGADIGPFLSELISEPVDFDGFDLKKVLAVYVQGDTARMSRITQETAAQRPQLFVDFLVEVILWRRQTSGLDDAIAPLGRLLEGSEGKLQRDALRVAALLAEADLEVSRLLPALTPLLKSASEEVVEAAAYALALEAVFRQDWPAVEDLRNRCSKWIRKGAYRGLVVRYRGREEVEPELLRRVVLGLLEPEAEVRGKILEIVVKAVREGRPARAPEDLLQELRSHPPSHPASRVLREYLHRVGASDEVDEGCELCRALPRQKSWVSERLLPAELRRLVEEGPWRFCPECHTAYAYDFYEEYDVNSCHRQWSLRRMSPTEAVEVLPEPRLSEARARHKKALQLAGKELDHPRQLVRIEAAWVLAEDCLERRDWGALQELLEGTDPDVRTEVYATAARPSRSPKVADVPDFDLPLEAITQGLREVNPKARGAAARILARQYVRTKDWRRFRHLVANADEAILESALLTASEEASNGASLSPVVEEFTRLFDHPEEKVRRGAERALAETRQTKKVKAARTALFERLIRDGDPDRHRDAAWAVVKAAKQGVCLGEEVLPVLGEQLHDLERVWAANCALLGMLRCGRPINAVLPDLFRALSDPELVDRGSFHETLWGLRDAGIDLREYSGELIAAMGSREPNIRQTAFDLVIGLHEAGADLGSFRQELLAFVPRLEGYKNEKIGGVLGDLAIRSQAWEDLAALLKHEDKELRWGTCRAIKYTSPLAGGAVLVLPALFGVLGDRGQYLRSLAGEAARAVLDREPDLRSLALQLLLHAPKGEPRDKLSTWLKGLTSEA